MKALSNLRQLAWLLVLWFVVVSLGLLGGFAEFSRRVLPEEVIASTPPPVLPPTLLLPEDASPPVYSSKSVWIYERTTGSLLYQDNADQATSVASLAKLMTALVAYESYDLQDVVPIASASNVVGNRAKFLYSDRFSVADLLRAMLIFSANDAAQAIANGIEGGEDAFINKMNQKVTDLGLSDTHFANSFGIDNPLQYSTAADIGLITNAVLAVPFLEDVVAQEKVLVRERNSSRIDTIYSTNVLLRQGSQFRGVKTGTTAQAGESLVVRYVDESEAVPRKLDLIIVLLGSSDRYADAKNLVKWITSAVVLNPDRLEAFSAE